jgi:hypothetical protein
MFVVFFSSTNSFDFFFSILLLPFPLPRAPTLLLRASARRVGMGFVSGPMQQQSQPMTTGNTNESGHRQQWHHHQCQHQHQHHVTEPPPRLTTTSTSANANTMSQNHHPAYEPLLMGGNGGADNNGMGV